jgi:hypothetical protein
MRQLQFGATEDSQRRRDTSEQMTVERTGVCEIHPTNHRGEGVERFAAVACATHEVVFL